MASTPKQGTYAGNTSPEGEDKQAKNEVAGCVSTSHSHATCVFTCVCLACLVGASMYVGFPVIWQLTGVPWLYVG